MSLSRAKSPCDTVPDRQRLRLAAIVPELGRLIGIVTFLLDHRLFVAAAKQQGDHQEEEGFHHADHMLRYADRAGHRSSA